MSTTTSSGPSAAPFVVLYFLAIFLPPLAVFLDRGCGADVVINIFLTILAWIPGIFHAWWVISKSERLYETTNRGVPYGAPAPVGTAAPTTTPTTTTAPATTTAPVTTTAPATKTAPGTAATTY